MLGHRRASRGTTPIDFDKYEKMRNHLADNEYMVMHRIQPPNPVQHHNFRNALIGLGLAGAGAAAAYHFRKPLLKLGQKAYNYGLDKFHNLFGSTNSTNPTIAPNPHNW